MLPFRYELVARPRSFVAPYKSACRARRREAAAERPGRETEKSKKNKNKRFIREAGAAAYARADWRRSLQVRCLARQTGRRRNACTGRARPEHVQLQVLSGEKRAEPHASNEKKRNAERFHKEINRRGAAVSAVLVTRRTPASETPTEERAIGIERFECTQHPSEKPCSHF